MAKGGYRPGAGRQHGSKNRPKQSGTAVVEYDFNGKPTPVEYMLAVMNDPTADLVRRDRMAIAAAPYCHTRMADQRITKKQATETHAEQAGVGSDWSDDLTQPDSVN